jgi:hypothetical protein
MLLIKLKFYFRQPHIEYLQEENQKYIHFHGFK